MHTSTAIMHEVCKELPNNVDYWSHQVHTSTAIMHEVCKELPVDYMESPSAYKYRHHA